MFLKKHAFKIIILGMGLLCLTSPLSSHDYWLSAENFFLSLGQPIELHLLVGDDLSVEAERPFQKDKTSSLALYTASGKKNLLQEIPDQNMPLLTNYVPDSEGLALVAMERNFSFIELPDSTFIAYLEHENLHDIAEMREKTGKRAKERERYARCLKSLLMVGDKNPDHNRLFNKELGHTLELLLLQNPYEKKKGDVLEVKLLYKNKILVKKAIEALHYDPIKGVTIQLIYTDNEGIARFQLNYSGMWVVRTVHLYPIANDDQVDWESYWASYSFAVAE